MRLRTIPKKIQNKRIVLRAELDVPIINKKVSSLTRLKANTNTIKLLLSRGASQISIIGHIGRPKGFEKEKSTRILLKYLKNILQEDIDFLEDFKKSSNKRLVLFENTRFFRGEISNNYFFAKQIASHGDIFVNNAFSTLTRKHASIVGVPKFLPTYAGLRIVKEIDALSIKNKKHPMVLILGGAKLETKMPVIKALYSKVDIIILGTISIVLLLNKFKGFKINSLFDYNFKSKSFDFNKVLMPIDFCVAKTAKSISCSVKSIDASFNQQDYVFDYGPKTISKIIKILSNAKTVIWNGPLGFYENPVFRKSSLAVAKTVSNSKMFSLIGGGDTEQVFKFAKAKSVDHICIGGGAMLKFLANESLPGLELLKY